MKQTVPRPIDLQRRWRCLSVISNICLPFGDKSAEAITSDVHRKIIRGMRNDFGGHYAWFACNDRFAAYYGFNANDPRKKHSVETQQDAIRELRRIPREAQALFARPRKNSEGWTFAMWTELENDVWHDVTGQDANCSSSARFPLSHSFYGSEAEVHEYVSKELQRSDLRSTIAQILLWLPLDNRMIARMWPKDSQTLAVVGRVNMALARNYAIRAGYPLSPDFEC